ncbi:MAG: histidine kinase, partial [bacterium]|nr:histidine kinase [bacterium]
IDDGVGLQKEDIMARSLGNIKQRLQYFFESAELTARNREEGGVVVELVFRV